MIILRKGVVFMNNKNYWQVGTRVGLFFAILFIVCFAWFYIRVGSSELKQLHDSLFALSFFGWSGMNFVSFILGLMQSFVWGYIAVALWNLTGIFSKGSDNN